MILSSSLSKQAIGKIYVFFLQTEKPWVCTGLSEGIIYSLDLDQMEKKLISQKIEDSILLVYTSDGQSIINGKLSDERVEQIWNLLQNQDMSSPGLEIVLDESKISLLTAFITTSQDVHFVMLQDYHIIQTRMAGMKKAAFHQCCGQSVHSLLLAVILANKLYYPFRISSPKSGSGQKFCREMKNTADSRLKSPARKVSVRYI